MSVKSGVSVFDAAKLHKIFIPAIVYANFFAEPIFDNDFCRLTELVYGGDVGEAGGLESGFELGPVDVEVFA